MSAIERRPGISPRPFGRENLTVSLSRGGAALHSPQAIFASFLGEEGGSCRPG
jgi:hypothetical protein